MRSFNDRHLLPLAVTRTPPSVSRNTKGQNGNRKTQFSTTRRDYNLVAECHFSTFDSPCCDACSSFWPDIHHAVGTQFQKSTKLRRSHLWASPGWFVCWSVVTRLGLGLGIWIWVGSTPHFSPRARLLYRPGTVVQSEQSTTNELYLAMCNPTSNIPI